MCWAEETASLVMPLPREHNDLSRSPRTYVEKARHGCGMLL